MIQTVTNNSPQQINAALFALDNSLENKTASLEKDIEAIKKNIKEDNDDGIVSGKTYDINISGNAETADYATRAEQDADGNTISSTYVKLEDLPNEVVTGVKGDAETTYRKGNVNITPANIGAATPTDITNAINALDVTEVGGAGKYISKIKETDGKISATVTTMDTAPTSASTKAVTSGGVYTAISDEATARDTAITNAINALDVGKAGGNKKYISAISETDGKISAIVEDVAQTYSSTGTIAASGKAIAAAIGTLDVSEVGGDGKYISKIKETDGKISATVTTMDTAPTANSTKAVTSDGIQSAISTAESNAEDLANATGTLAIAHGGTGTDSQANINTNFIADLSEGTSDVTDGTMFVSSYASDNGFSDTNAVNKPYKRKFSHVWNYIKGKIGTAFGLQATKTDNAVARWDGTDGKLQDSGVTIDDNADMTVNNVHIGKGKSIYADGTKANTAIIKMKDNTSDAYGNGIVIGGGGAVVIGAGESADTYYSGAGLTPGDESTRITADNSIVFASNLNSNYASRKEMTMGTDGKLTNNNGFVGYLTGNISGSSTSCTGNSASADYTRGNAYCTTAAGTGAKTASMRGYVLVAGGCFPITFTNANSYNGKITLDVNSKGAKDIWINGTVSGSTNKTLPAGTYLCYYDGSKYLIDTSYSIYISRRAVQDGSGNEISSTYATKSEVPTKVSELTNDSGFITSSGSITGSSGSCTGNSATATTATNLTGFQNNNSTGKDANTVLSNAITYYTSNGPTTTQGATTNDGALFVQAYSDNWVGQIAQDYRNGTLFVRGKNNGTWKPWHGIAKMDKVNGAYYALLPLTGENNWIQIGTANTSYGILPSQAGAAGSGHNYIGTSSWYWKYAYIDQIYGYLNGNISGSSTSCTGNSATATKATQDGNGNNIASTYATKDIVSINSAGLAPIVPTGPGMPRYLMVNSSGTAWEPYNSITVGHATSADNADNADVANYATTAYKIRTSAPSSPAVGDIWIS